MEQFDALTDELARADRNSVTMDVCIGGKHFKINNADFIRGMFRAVDCRKPSSPKTPPIPLGTKGNYIDQLAKP